MHHKCQERLLGREHPDCPVHVRHSQQPESSLHWIRKQVRASEAFGSRALAEDEEELLAEEVAEDVTDLEIEDGVSDVPLVRLVNSILFQAAEDGASDVHFAPEEVRKSSAPIMCSVRSSPPSIRFT